MRNPIPTIACVHGILAILAGPIHAQTIGAQFSDTEFGVTNWVHEEVYDDANQLAFSTSHESLGGNPGPNVRILFGTATGDGTPDPLDVAVGHFRVGAIVDPAAFPIESMSFAIDVEVQEGGVSGGVWLALLIRQSDVDYIGPSFFAADQPGWFSHGQDGLDEIDFRDIMTLQTPPDLSPAGIPLELGFVTLNGTATTTGISQDLRVDNWSVTIYEGGATGVEANLPSRLSLSAAPNPFRAATTVRYDNARFAHVEVAVFDVAGRRIRTLVDRLEGPGLRQAMWSGSDATGALVPTGRYFVRFRSGRHTETAPVTLIR
ncbi:hypothetical protein K8I85_05110 [bacterium]|nr:hypothetical protein [bacterium]